MKVETTAAVGNPPKVINSISEEAPGTLVAMTIHARTGVARTMLGSVAESVVRQTHVPTLLLRPTVAAKQEKLQKEKASAKS